MKNVEGNGMENENRWTAEEVAILAAHNGSPREATAALARAGYKRSASSVATKIGGDDVR